MSATDSGIGEATSRVAADYARHKSLLASVTASIGELWDTVKLVFEVATGIRIPSLMYTLGVLAQILSNQIGGVLDPLLAEVEDPEFHTGRNTGDRISMIIGAGEIIAGIIMIIAAITITAAG